MISVSFMVGSHTKWNHETGISRSMVRQAMACVVLDLEWAARSASTGDVGAPGRLGRRQITSRKRLEVHEFMLHKPRFSIENSASFVGLYMQKTQKQQRSHSKVDKPHNIFVRCNDIKI